MRALTGQVVLDQGDSVVVRFEHGIEACLAANLELVKGVAERMAAGRLDPALHVVTRILGECIRSVNDAWGVFSRSRIALLPHQLWVCKRVLESWPTRWLVADDVGLGKTIEAGLILTPLLSSGRVRRLLVLAPASLVEQWQVRLREMFDIRLSIYVSDADTEASDFWNTHDRVVASAHTLRLDKGKRWERLFDANPWDLVFIDEAHHMNVDTVVDESFADRSVLFFTEYKATQALLMSALHKRYGDGCVTFINGDGFIADVQDSTGNVSNRTEDRHRAAARFNRGEVRFLVSTEAAGEGVDLQEHCSALIHVDLPWNPMRLHQRVGRLSRYGQTAPVDVVTVRNPDTVESRIWDLLDEKLARINLAFQGAMDDPEDIRQLVIGMASPGMFTKVFADAAPALGGQTLDEWFDKETATFGGEDAVNTVRSLVGHVARFDFGAVAGQIPRVDLPDLVPFFKAILSVRSRRPDQVENLRLRFRPPEEWKDDFSIAVVERYDLLFAREPRPKAGEDVAGVGLRVVGPSGSGCGGADRGFRRHPGPGRTALRVQGPGPHHWLGWSGSRRRRSRPVGW